MYSRSYSTRPLGRGAILYVLGVLTVLATACGPSLEDGTLPAAPVVSASGYYTDGGTYMAQQDVTVKAAGLWRTDNELDAPPGSLDTARNVAIRRQGIVDQRRGQEPNSSTFNTGTVDALASFEDVVIAHDSDGKMYWREDGTSLIALTGTFNPPTGQPTRFVGMGGALYATTDDGLVRQDAPTDNPVAAGVPPGLEGSGTTTGSSGWLYGGVLASGTVTLGGAAGDLTVTINGTAVGPVVYAGSDIATAAAMVTAINANGTLAPLVTASSGGTAVITINADTAGTDGNYTLTASRTAGTAVTSGATLTGGAAGLTTGYRLVWGERDGDSSLMLGAPSGRILVTNNTGGTRDTTITTPLPDGIVYRRHFLQAYRTVNTSTGGDPGEDMAQVGEFWPTQADIAAGTFTVTDIASFANGPSGYFSPSQGFGLSDQHDPPPVLTDAVEFQGYMVGVVQAYTQTLEIDLVAIGGDAGLAVGQGLIFYVDGVQTFNVAANASENASLGNFKLYTNSTAAENIDATARSLVRVLNGYGSSVVYASYASADADLPGKIIITARSPGQGVLSVRAFSNPNAWVPLLGSRLFVTTIVRAGTTVTATLAPATGAASLQVGQQIEMTSVDPLPVDPDFPLGVKTITSVNIALGKFTYTETGAATTGTKDVYIFETADGAYGFDQAASTASYALSNYREPDSFPPRLRFNAADDNVTLYRITKQGDALHFWTNAGLYRFAGSTENDFSLRPMDPTVLLVAPKTVQTLSNQTFALTKTGVVRVTDVGVDVISGPIEQILRQYYSTSEENLARISASAFAVAYESEGEYILFLPDLSDTLGAPATQAYVFNVNTRTWVGPWDFHWEDYNEETGYVKTGFINPADNRLYLASVDRLFRERKDRAASDYQDDEGSGIPIEAAYTVNSARNAGAYKQWIETTLLMSYQQPASLYMYFKTEIDTNEEGGTITTQGNLAPRTYVPLNKSRSARLTVGMRHSTAAEQCSLLGVSQTYNVASTRVGR
jgi:hypothetical protein